MFWEDDHLPSQYNINMSQAQKIHSDPKERRFKLDRWLYPIFLDYADDRTTEIVKGMLLLLQKQKLVQINLTLFH